MGVRAKITCAFLNTHTWAVWRRLDTCVSVCGYWNQSVKGQAPRSSQMKFHLADRSESKLSPAVNALSGVPCGQRIRPCCIVHFLEELSSPEDKKRRLYFKVGIIPREEDF